MEEKIIMLKEQFERIKNLQWIESIRSGSTGIGCTFEQLLGCSENNLEIPDYEGIEIKTKRTYSKSYTTLFNCTPIGKHYHEIERIKDTYGYPDNNFRRYKVINNSIFTTKRTWIGTKYQFMLKVDRNKKKIFLCIFNVEGNLIEKDIYWDFDDLKEKLYRKCEYIAYINTLRKFINTKEYFKYYNLNIYKLNDFETFLILLDNGVIRITFKISVFKSGKRKGQIHDHGTGFDILESDMSKLYSIIY